VRKIRKKVLKASDLEASLPVEADSSKDLATRTREKPKMDRGGFKPVEEAKQDDNMDISDSDEGEAFHLDTDDVPRT
jgi:hypothetical protein